VRVEGSPNVPVQDVGHAQPGVVLHGSGAEVVEEAVDGEVAPEGVDLGGAEGLGGHARPGSVRLRPQVHEVQEETVDDHGGGLEVLALLGVALDD